MTDEELEISILGLIYKISAITGVQIPDKETMPFLIEQMILAFKEKYSFFNADEILYSFRNYKTNEWGKNFNLNYVDDCIQQYKYRRKEVSLIEEGLIKPQIEYKENRVTDEEKAQDLIYYVQKYKENFYMKYNDDFMLLPLYLYDYLVDLNLLDVYPDDRKKELKEKAMDIRIDQINEETRCSASHTNNNPYFRIMQKKSFREKDFPEYELLKMENIYKKLVILDYIKDASKR